MAKAVRKRSGPGRPRIYKDVAEVLAVRLPKSILKEVDAYAKGIRGRSALIRIMIEEGLERRKSGRG
jgi:metal-responsive CopG/Arc/MetJ family transcriptional regulator